VHIRTPELTPASEALAAKLLGREPAVTPCGNGGVRPYEPHAPIETSREERSPEDWTLAELREVFERTRGEGGIAREDRRHWLRVYRDCFVGAEAVAWWIEHEGLTRNEARMLGARLAELGWIRHVLDEHGFVDGELYYRFAEPRA
jgi:hypothetical protein